MNEVFSSVMFQALYYGVWGALILFFVGAFQRGFFINYFKVRTSFGRLVLVKIRTPLRDYFARGWVEEGFLVYKIKTGFREYDTIRLNIKPGSKPFYKCMSVAWVDVDDEKHAIAETNYNAVTGFDAIKHSQLLTRALQRPTIASGQEKLMMILIVVVGLIALGSLYMAYMSYANVQALNVALPELFRNLAGTVTGGRTL